METNPLLAVTNAVQRGIDSEHDGLVTGCFSPLNQLSIQAALGLQIKLEPARPSAALLCRSGNLFQTARSQRAEHHTDTQRRGGVSRRQFAIRVKKLLPGNRRQQDRVGQFAAQQGGSTVAAGNIGHHPGQQHLAIKGGAVPAVGQLIGGSAIEIGPSIVVQPAAGVGRVIGHRRDIAGNAVEQRRLEHQLSAQRRSRL